jgi:nucleotide-binding universal stress UspA family protein
MKQIIIATDYSKAAVNATRYGVEMAQAINAGILLFHVYQMPVGYSEFPLSINLSELQEAAESGIMRLKNELTQQTAGKLPIETEARMGTFSQELERICEDRKPYAVVMGSQGSSAAERLMLGSHTVHAMKHLHTPVIAVPPGVSYSGIKKIGLACDFEEVVDTTPVEEIRTLIGDFRAQLHVLNTGSKGDYNPEVVYQSGLLQEMLGPLKPEYHFIDNKDIDEGIVEFCDRNAVDLLVVLPKRHSLLDKLVHRSHTRRLVLHSHTPVMSLHE